MKNDRMQSTTVLAFLKVDGKIHMGADRLSSWGFSKSQSTVRSKVVKIGHMMYAGTGTVILIDEIIRTFKAPSPTVTSKKSSLFGLIKTEVKEEMDAGEYIRGPYLKALREHLTARGYIASDKFALNADIGSLIIIGYKGRLFELTIDMDLIGVYEIDATQGYAVGCGGLVALGSLYTTRGTDMSPYDRLKIACHVAGEISPGCNTEFDYIVED